MLQLGNLRKDLTLAAVCVGVGLLLYIVGWVQLLWLSVLVSLGVGFVTRYGRFLLRRWAPQSPLWAQYLLSALVAMILCGGIPFLYIYLTIPGRHLIFSLNNYLPVFAIICVVTLVICYFYYSREDALLLQHALDRAELARAKNEKQMLEVRLRLLQSQIEPHFLFNTLANVQSLIDIEPKQASKMLGAMTSLLRQSLHCTRHEWLTLGDELSFNRAYLTIQQMRLGDRLRVHFDIAADVQDNMPFPPLLLQPLIENAVLHGIEPLRGGGKLQVSLKIKDECLNIRLFNDSVVAPGRSAHRGHKVGLRNTRERLRRLYGDAASFSYQGQSPQGVLVTMEIPLHVNDLSRPDRG